MASKELALVNPDNYAAWIDPSQPYEPMGYLDLYSRYKLDSYHNPMKDQFSIGIASDKHKHVVTISAELLTKVVYRASLLSSLWKSLRECSDCKMHYELLRQHMLEFLGWKAEPKLSDIFVSDNYIKGNSSGAGYDHPHYKYMHAGGVVSNDAYIDPWGGDTYSGTNNQASEIFSIVKQFVSEETLSTVVTCPECGNPGTFRRTVIHLNDDHYHSFDKIADWMETLSLNIAIERSENAS